MRAIHHPGLQSIKQCLSEWLRPIEPDLLRTASSIGSRLEALKPGQCIQFEPEIILQSLIHSAAEVRQRLSPRRDEAEAPFIK